MWLNSQASLLIHKMTEILHIFKTTTTKKVGDTSAAAVNLCLYRDYDFHWRYCCLYNTVSKEKHLPLCWPMWEWEITNLHLLLPMFHPFLPNSWEKEGDWMSLETLERRPSLAPSCIPRTDPRTRILMLLLRVLNKVSLCRLDWPV